jgi:hypothetical protein
MEAATVSAIASAVSATAAWIAFGSTTHRAKKDWQRTTVLQSAVTILQLCQERHNREHELLGGDGELTPNANKKAKSELKEISDRIEKAHIQLSLVATPKVAKASRDIVDLMIELDLDVIIFEHDHPRGGQYKGRMYCLQSVRPGKGSVEAALSRAISQHSTTATQRLVKRIRRCSGSPKSS